MGRFLFLVCFFVVVIGLVLHFKVDVPWVGDWLGKLPGDLIIKKGGLVLYAPLTTSALISFVLSLLDWLLFRSGK